MNQPERHTFSSSFYKILSIVLLFVILIGVLWQITMRKSPAAGSNDTLASPDIGAGAPIPVKTTKAFRGDLIIRITATGETRAVRQVVFHAEVPGRVRSVPVREGEAVQRGELLFQMEDEGYRLALKEAKEQLAQATLRFGEQLVERQRNVLPDSNLSLLDLTSARQRLESARRAYAKGKISKSAFQLAEQEWAAAELFHRAKRRELIALRTGVTEGLLRVEKARLDLQHTRAVAPFSGLIGNVKIQPGVYVAAGEECLTLIDMDSLLMDVEILESELAEVEQGRRATAVFSAYPGETFQGKIVAVNPLIDPERKTRRATVLLPNARRRLLPGMHGTVKLEAKVYHNRLLVPREAVVLRDQRPVVFIARKDAEGNWRAVWSYVDLGLQNETYVEIVNSRFGLREGEPVIVSNHYTMVHDARIRIVE